MSMSSVEVFTYLRGNRVGEEFPIIGKVVLASFLLCWVAMPARAATEPQEVPPDVWAKIGPQVERQMYAFDAEGRAFNPEQDFQVAAETAGLAVNGLLRLRATALNGEPLPEVAPVVRENRVEYPRGAVTEWFENRQDGVEQGFTVKDEVGRLMDEVRLTLAFGDNMTIEVAADGLEAIITRVAARYRYAGLKAWDATGRELTCRMAPKSEISNLKSQILLLCDARGAQFPITIDPILTSMEAKLAASDKAANDGVGWSVSVDGDVALVGAYQASPGGITQAGAAYVYERNAGGTNAWGQVAKLTASDKASSDYFGWSVSVAGDVALVGSLYADPSGVSAAGAAYVYERNAGGTNAWGEVAQLTASDKAELDYFGASVSVAGDVAVVGAHYADPGGVSAAGAAYVFERNTGGTNAWGQVAKLTASDKAASDYFGTSVSVAGDVAVVGAQSADPGGVSAAGAAYVFERNAGGTNVWGQVAKLTAADKAVGDYFGISVSVAGDVALVGAANADPGGMSQAGAAYVFERNADGTNAWGEVAKLTAEDKAANDYFGTSVSVAGGVALVGAYQADPGGTFQAGAAYVFERNADGTNAWGQVAKLTASDKAVDDYFGTSVSVAGGVALVGAYQANPGGVENAGAAYVIPFNREEWRGKSKLTASDKAAGDNFGFSVSVDGDVALVGSAYADPDGASDAGAAYVYERNAGGTNAWGEVARLTASDRAAGDNFGYAVTVAGDVALVGSLNADPGSMTNAGAAYVFERNAGGTNAWGQVAKLVAADKSEGNCFGNAVRVAGDLALIGAYQASPGGVAWAGASYVFERNAGGTNAWGQVAKLTASDKAIWDYFGWSVSLAGDVALVGAVWSDPGSVAQAGAAYVFERNAGGTNAWGQVAKLTASDKAADDWFGWSVSVDGDVALIGAVWANPGGLENAGAAYVFERNAGGTNAWGPVVKMTAPDKATNDWFGSSVSVAGDVALVGADLADPAGVADAGAAYVFERNVGGTNAWGQAAKLTASDKAVLDYFGWSVCVAGDVALVGAYQADPGGITNAGAVYVFEGLINNPPPEMVVLGTNSAAITNNEAASAMKGTYFGPVHSGAALAHTFILTNSGGSVLTISGVASNGAQPGLFSVSGLPATLAAASSTVFSVTYSPVSFGEHSDALIISNNSPSGVYTMNLAGVTFQTTPSSGPYSGGNTITITNAADFGAITNVLVGGIAATIQASGANWVRITLPGPGSAGVKDIVIQTDNQAVTLANAYTYNPAGMIGDRFWSPPAWTNLGAGLDDVVIGLAMGRNGELYAGGTFTTAGGVPANRVACWDGTSWTNLGTGLNSYVFSLATGTNGELYAGGQFTTAGGAPAERVARWDGTSWTNLGAGLGGLPYALVVGTNGYLYAGGWFTTAGGAPANYVARWNGTSWTNLGAGLGHIVYALALGSNGDLYAGGSFTTAGGAPANYVARWDGTSWMTLGAGLDNTVLGLAMGPNGLLYAGGWFTTAGGVPANQVASWNGTNWTNLGAGVDSEVRPLAVGTNGDLYAGGQFTTAGGTPAEHVARWDGTSWTNLGTGMNTDVRTFAFGTNGDVYAGGFFINAGGTPANYVAKWGPSLVEIVGVTPGSGSWTGGYLVVISGTNLCDGGDVTNVTLCGVPAAIQMQSATQVVVLAGAAGGPATGDVVVFSTSYGNTVKSKAFAYALPSEYTITASAGPHGSIVPSGAVVVQAGDDQPFTFTPNQWYRVDDVLVDDVSVGAMSSYNWTNVLADGTIEVFFAEKYVTNNTPVAVPETWMAEYGLTNDMDTLVNEDLAGVGATTWQLYVMDANPTSGVGVLVLDSVQLGENQRIQWLVSSNRVYTLYGGTNLHEGVQTWITGPIQPATNGIWQHNEPVAEEEQGFYRVKVDLP